MQRHEYADNDGRDDNNDSDDAEGLGRSSIKVASILSAAVLNDLTREDRLALNSASDDDDDGGIVAASDDQAPDTDACRRALFVHRSKAVDCYRCTSPAKYTCPRCGVRTCSLPCIRIHKGETGCTGIVDVAGMVPLSQFTDQHLQRDFRFIQDVTRVVDNTHRGLQHVWRFSHRALPPPLHALREAAKRRGVLCQITSEGMAKRDRNTSRYDRRRDAIIWRVEFHVRGAVASSNFTAATSWGNERFLLFDIFSHVWEVNPMLPSYHVRRGYNRASQWVGQSIGAPKHEEAHEADADDTANGNCSEEKGVLINDDDPVIHEPNDAVTMSTKLSVQRFLDGLTYPRHDLLFLIKADRIGDVCAYYPLDPNATLHDNLRSVFFINEFPEIIVAHKSDAPLFPLITEELRVRVRESFRGKHAVREVKHGEGGSSAAAAAVTGGDGDPPRRTDFSALTEAQREKMKRVPCRNFRKCGYCDRGEGCPFWHCPASDVPACRSMVTMGMCPLGPKCSFSHDEAIVMRTRENPEFRRVQRGHSEGDHVPGSSSARRRGRS